MFNYAGIIVNQESAQLDKIFTYKIPESLKSILKVGMRVKVPFGMGNKKIDGYVIELYEENSTAQNMKEIASIYDPYPLLRQKDIALVKWIREKYLATYLEGIKCMVPSGIVKGIQHKVQSVIGIGKELEGKYIKEPYIGIFKFIEDNNGKFNKTELCQKQGFSLSSINTLLKHEFLITTSQIINRYNTKTYEEYNKKELNSSQNKIVDAILQSEEKKYLLHGVTGSGKTEIYMHLVEEMLKCNKASIVLVPEISLTPQMVERFKGRFGKDISVFHSRLSEGERFDEWVRIKEGKVKIAIGARSALFLPFDNLGLIIIDEEHESSYKSESDPKYNAKEVAEMKCTLEDCKMVLGSATPSIETYYKTLNGNLGLLTISERADGALLPDVQIVDMRDELTSNNKSIFSKALYDEIEKKLAKKEQIILFVNRRGFSSFVSCRKCGYVFKCTRCDVTLTYHLNENYLTCHYCGQKQKVSHVCPQCGSKYVKHFGTGTEKVEQEIRKFFPKAKTIRMDFDTTRKKNSHEEIYQAFKQKKADILIGTQMVAKGLDFKDVTLVGIIAADLSLNLPDFKASERTFQLLTQVSGRAGRGQKPGTVIVQTYNPDHYSIKYAATYEYLNFYNEEIKIRENMNYPPFTQLFCITFTSKNEALLIKNIQNIAIKLKNTFISNDKIVMLGPCPCGINKIKEQFRWQILFKGELSIPILNKMKQEIYELTKSFHSEIKISMDVNPNSII